MEKKVVSLLAIVYLIIRFAFIRELDALGANASYIFEAVLVTVTVVLLRREFVQYLKIPKATFAYSLVSLATGFGIFKIAVFNGITIPFDLNAGAAILFLLLVGPLLEELLFRYFLWRPVEMWTLSKKVTLVLTTLLFSYAHLHAIWFVPNEYHQFILYQTVYTLVLGGACGYFMYKQQSLTSAILIHFTFNLGFYLGSVG